MAVKDIIPNSNVLGIDVRDTLIHNGADWSLAPIKDANVVENYFNKWAKINKWSRCKPVVNKANDHKGFDYPKNFRSTPDGSEAYGLIYEKADVWKNIHKQGWKYNSQESGNPLRLEDFVGYYPKARTPLGVSVEKWWVNRLTFMQIDEVNSTEIQLSLDDFDLFEGGQTYYFGFVVDNMIQTKPKQRIMEFDFRPIMPNQDTERTVTAVLHPEEIKDWTNISVINTAFKPISLPNYEGLQIKFERFIFISDIRFFIENYDLRCGRFSTIDPHKNYEVETVLNGTPPKFMRDGFKYRVYYSGITDDRILAYDETFIPNRDLTISGSRYIYRIKVGEILANYNVEKHFVRDKKIEFSLKELKKIDNIEFESDNYISSFYMTMKD